MCVIIIELASIQPKKAARLNPLPEITSVRYCVQHYKLINTSAQGENTIYKGNEQKKWWHSLDKLK
jgi:hypothetical protein